MIKILDHTKSLSSLVGDMTNGLGRINAINPTVTEELNGIYECEFDVLQSDPHFEDLEVNGLLEIPVSDGSGQIFRIYRIDKAINNVSRVFCQHISYDLVKVPVEPFSATGSVPTCNGMVSHIQGSYPFTMTTNIANTTSQFKLDIPRTFRECLGGYEGSVLDVFRPEYEWDNLTVKMLNRRGSDNGVRIAYGKNLTDFQQEENIESVYTAVWGYAVVDDVTYYGSIYHKVVATYPRVKIVDFSSDYESGEVPTSAELTTKATSYATNNDIEIPSVNLTISFVPLYQTEEYKNIAPLERVFLGDTVHVYFDKLNVEANARVIKTVWNVNLQKYDEIELGSAKANLNSVIKDTSSEVVNNALAKFDADIDVSWLDEKLDNMVSLIANGMGLHMTQDSSGRIFLHNGDTLANSQYQYQITSSGFMMSDDYGATWNSGWTTSGDAVMNSLATITLRALEIYGSFLRFGDVSSNYIDVAPYSSNNVPQGVSFDGTGSIRMQPQGLFNIYNLDGNNNHYNEFTMNHQGSTYSSNYISLNNNDDTHNYIRANLVELEAHRNQDNSISNQLMMINYATETGTQYQANTIRMYAYSSSNYLYLRNNRVQNATNTLYANSLNMTATSTTSSAGLYNYKYSDTTSANYLSFSSSATSNATFLYNYKYSTNALANSLTLSGASGSNGISLNNKKPSDDLTANAFSFNAGSTSNSMGMNNYHLNSDAIANYFTMSASESGTTFFFANRKVGGVETANSLNFTHTSTYNSLNLYNYDISSNTLLNYLQMHSNGNLQLYNRGTLSILNNNSSGTQTNSLIMSSDQTTTLWSASDLRLRSSGAVRVFANTIQGANNGDYYQYNNGGTQDAYIGGYSLKLQCSNRIYLYYGSTRYYLTCDSDGYVRCHSA